MVRMLVVALLTSSCISCGFSGEELGLIASWVMHGVEQTRIEVEGLDVSRFGSSSLVVALSAPPPTGPQSGGQFQVMGQVDSSCTGKASVSGSGRHQQERFDYLVNLALARWGSCDGSVALDGTVHATVTADAVTVTSFRDRPAVAQAAGDVEVTGAGIEESRRGRTVYFDLTMSSGVGAEPTVCGDIDGEQICD